MPQGDLSFTMIIALVAAAAAIAAALIVLLRPLLIRYAMARPNFRSSHREPTPQGGGIAVMAAVLLVASAAITVTAGRLPDELPLVFGAAFLLMMVGAVDDVRALPASFRLLLHAMAVGMVLAALSPELRILPALPIWFERTLLLLAGVWIVNLVNFMDGIDWMTVAEFIPISAGIVAIGILIGLPAHAIVVALALLGALLGFAPFNRPVARLFLGDVGSLPLGLILGWLLVLIAGKGQIVAAVILPLYYLADATLTLLRRLANREAVWLAHRTHFYQRATDNGYSVPQIVRMVFLANCLLVAISLIAIRSDALPTQIAALAAAGAVVARLLWRMSQKQQS